MRNIPQEDWTKPRLGEFVSGLSKKWAKDGWLMGRALNIACGKMKHGEWLPWCRQYCPDLSKDTILRLRKLPEWYPDPNKLDGKRLMTAYLEAGIVAKQERKTVPKWQQSPVVNAARQEQPKPPATPVPDKPKAEQSRDPARARAKTPPSAPGPEQTTKDHLGHVRELALLMIKHLVALDSKEEVRAAAEQVEGFEPTLEELHVALNSLGALLKAPEKRVA